MPKGIVDPLSIMDSFAENDFAEAMEAVQIPKDEASSGYISPIAVVKRNANTLNEWAPTWLKWASVLTPTILKDFEVDSLGVGHRERSVSYLKLPPVEHPESLAIIAPGPSLDETISYLKHWKGYILASTTALSTLFANGITPHMTVAVDANEYLGELLRQAPYESWGVKLLIPNTVCLGVASAFETERYWFKSFIQGTNGGNNPFNRFMEYLHPWIRSWIFQAGCVTNAAFLLSTCLNLRGNADIQKVFLFGADFGYPGEKSRCVSYSYEASENRWIPRPVPSIAYQTVRAPNAISANGLHTDIGMLGYKRSLYTIWYIQGRQRFKISDGEFAGQERMTPCLYSCSRGILFELPWCDPEETAKASGSNVSLYDDTVINETFAGYMGTSGILEGQIKEDDLGDKTAGE